MAQGLALCVIHVIHACAPVCWCLELSVFFLVFPSFYFLSLFLFQLYLTSTSAPDEMSVPNPLCDSSLGSVVTSDYVTPLTEAGGEQIEPVPHLKSKQWRLASNSSSTWCLERFLLVGLRILRKSRKMRQAKACD